MFTKSKSKNIRYCLLCNRYFYKKWSIDKKELYDKNL